MEDADMEIEDVPVEVQQLTFMPKQEEKSDSINKSASIKTVTK